MGLKVPENGSIRILVTVKAYPNPSTTHGETVCVAGIRTDSESPAWVRLYPLEYRDLRFSQQFAKYQEITVEVVPASDPRPETVRPKPDTLILGRRVETWMDRKPLVEPLMAESMCEIQRRQALDGTSLGIFRPQEVSDFTVDKESRDSWTEKQRNSLGQTLMFGNGIKSILQKIPYSFTYHYRCRGHCNGHRQKIIDWEIGEAYRSWGYPEAERLARIRDRWLNVLFGKDRDSALYVGNMFQHPRSFVVLGVFWPPLREFSPEQQTLTLD